MTPLAVGRGRRGGRRAAARTRGRPAPCRFDGPRAAAAMCPAAGPRALAVASSSRMSHAAPAPFGGWRAAAATSIWSASRPSFPLPSGFDDLSPSLSPASLPRVYSAARWSAVRPRLSVAETSHSPPSSSVWSLPRSRAFIALCSGFDGPPSRSRSAPDADSHGLRRCASAALMSRSRNVAEHAAHLEVVLLRREEERRHAVLVLLVHVRAGVEQHRRHLHVVPDRRDVQRVFSSGFASRRRLAVFFRAGARPRRRPAPRKSASFFRHGAWRMLGESP